MKQPSPRIVLLPRILDRNAEPISTRALPSVELHHSDVLPSNWASGSFSIVVRGVDRPEHRPITAVIPISSYVGGALNAVLIASDGRVRWPETIDLSWRRLLSKPPVHLPRLFELREDVVLFLAASASRDRQPRASAACRST